MNEKRCKMGKTETRQKILNQLQLALYRNGCEGKEFGSFEINWYAK